MHIRYRRIYFATLSLLFLLIAPILIWYAMGWRYDPGSGRVLFSGSLTVTSIPDRSEVLLDGIGIGLTPMKARRIVPGVYLLTIRAEGWVDYSEQILITSGQATAVKNISLIRSAEQISPSLSGQVRFAVQDPSRQHVFIEIEQNSTSSLKLLSDSAQSDVDVGTLSSGQRVTQAAWSPDSSHIAYTLSDSRAIIYRYRLSDSGTPESLHVPEDFTPVNILWDSAGGSRLYASSGQEIWSSETGKRFPLPVGTIGVAIYDGRVYTAVSSERSGTTISMRSLESLSDQQIFSDRAFTKAVSLSLDDQYLIVHDVSNSVLWVFDRTRVERAPNTYTNINNFSMNKKTGNLLLWNDHELYWEDAGVPAVIARYGEPLRSPAWVDAERIVFLLGDSVYSAYIEREPAVVLRLYQLDAERVFINAKSDTMFAIVPNGLARLEIGE